MEKKILTKEELMELKTSHKVIESYNTAEGYTYDPTDTMQAALRKLYILEQLINQEQCVIYPVTIGDLVWYVDTTDENLGAFINGVHVEKENFQEIINNWDTKYFTTKEEAATKLSTQYFKENEIIIVYDNPNDKEYPVLRHFKSYDSVRDVFIVYPYGANKEMFELGKKYCNYEETELQSWKCAQKIPRGETK